MPTTPSVATYKTIGALASSGRNAFAINVIFRLFIDRMSLRTHKNWLLSATIRALGSLLGQLRRLVPTPDSSTKPDRTTQEMKHG
jgi:phage gp46-like protein